ncbi:MAG: enoyl-CoA hydratase/isomerase family protein [Gemmatimonadota bacterium]|nr:MAG: enoyl-CoA hydratase/isomerase family protein [Gemmatimonadota bacterium]
MLHREDHGAVAVLRMEHGKANALDLELIDAIGDALRDIEEAGSHSAVVLTGTGPMFSAGVDLFRFLESGDSYLNQFFEAMVRSFRALFTFPRPLVAAVNGHAIAGGAVMAAAADYRVMSIGNGKIGVPELRVGIPFPVAAIEILRFAASTQHLQELVYLGRAYAVEEAHQVGLIDEIAEAPALRDRALDVAQSLGSMPPARFGITKRELRAPAIDRIERLSPRIDPEVLEGWKAPETHRAIRAYVEQTLKKT